MKNIIALLLIAVTVLGCSAPKPSKISLTGRMKPVNFDERRSDNKIVIKSLQIQNCWRKQFVYFFDQNYEYSPQFFYAIAHADKIAAYIKPPFVDFVFSKVQLGLRNYGATAPIELFLEEEKNQTEQVVLECIKYGCKKCKINV